MEPANIFTHITLGAAALIPNANIERKSPQVQVYLSQWQNSLLSQVSFETLQEPGSTRIPLLTLPVGATDVGKEVEIKKNSARSYASDNYVLESCIYVKPHENNDFSLRLRCQRYVSQTETNYLSVCLRAAIHTRQVIASCPVFDKKYEWEPDEPLKNIYLLISGNVAGHEMQESTIRVQEIRCVQVPSLLELTMQVVNRLIDEKKFEPSKIPADTHELLANIRLIQHLNSKK